MNAVSLTVNGVRVSVPAGSTLLEAARAAGIGIPTLCRLEGYPHQTACGVCIVEAGSGRLAPSCSCPAEEGLDVMTGSPAALLARKAAVELLLSEHSGDCRAPCSRACPAGLDVMGTVRLFEAGDARGALALTLETLPFPGLMAASCAGYCERVCRRAGLDSAIDIRGAHAAVDRAATDHERAAMIAGAAPSGLAVSISGTGPAALSAAFFLRRAGRPVSVIGDPMETLRRAQECTEKTASALEREIRILSLSGCLFLAGTAADSIMRNAARAESPGAILELDLGTEEWRIPARAIARGRRAALAILEGDVPPGGAAAPIPAPTPREEERPFESVITDITEEELRSLDSGVQRSSGGGRCLACGCAREHDCRLRLAAQSSGADRRRFPGGRIPARRSRFQMGRSTLVFEPGKCIRCGICVRLSARTPYPLSFMGRGFTVEAGGFGLYRRPECAPVFGRIAAACPTGCLSWEDGREDGNE